MPTNTTDIVCPHCKKKNTWTNENLFRPFCSERCRLIDLGDWASEKHRIPDESSEGKIQIEGDGEGEE